MADINKTSSSLSSCPDVPNDAGTGDALPALSDLLGAMKNNSVTNGWDVVTSYSVQKLNEVLKAQYNDKMLVDEVAIETTGLDPITEETFPISVKLSLGAPLLQFIAGKSGTCILTMPVESGTYAIAGKSPKPFPDNVYNIICIVPLVAINGTTKDVCPPNQPIAFTEGTNDENHIILHFKNKEYTKFDIKTKDGSTYPQDDILNLYVVPKLCDYFSKNVKEIDYSPDGKEMQYNYALTSVSNKLPQNDVMLQPKAFVFASAGEQANGVLSLYIQTVGSNNPAGNINPSFQPGGIEMLPIPKEHTASIIISHNLIARQYISDQLTKAGYGVNEVAAQDGLLFKISVGKSIIKDVSSHSIWDNFNVDGIDASFASDPISLAIKDGNIIASWSFSQTLVWSEHVAFSETPGHWGKVNLNITMSKTVAFNIDNEQISANLAITPSDYSINTSACNLSFCEKFFQGGVEYLPSVLGARNLCLDLPQINLNLGGLGFFPITNLIFPGNKHVIDIDHSAALSTPYDIMLTGQLSPSHQLAPASANHLLAVMSSQYSGMAVPASKNAQALLNDIFTKDKLAAQVFNIVADGDAGKLKDWLQRNNYSVLADDLQQCINALTSGTVNGLAANDVPAGDIRIWGGTYEVSMPSALAGKQLVISPKTGQATFDNTLITVSVTSNTSISWQLAGKTYTVTFSDHYGSDGEVLPATFEGTITTPPATQGGESTSEEFKGSQLIYEKPDNKAWYESPAILIISFVTGMIGFSVGMLQTLKDNCKCKSVEQVREGRKVADQAVEMQVMGHQELDAGLWEGIDSVLNDGLSQLVNEELRRDPDRYRGMNADQIVAAVPAEVQGRFRDQFEGLVWSALKPKIQQDIGPGLAVLIDIEQSRRRALDLYSNPKYEALIQDSGAGSYYSQVIKSTAANFKKEAFRQSGEQAAQRAAAADVACGRTQGELDHHNARQAEIETELAKQGISEVDEKRLQAEKQQLKKAIEDETRHLHELEQERDTARQEAADRQQDERQAEAERVEAERRASERKHEIFGE